jgi:hypothetical protein
MRLLLSQPLHETGLEQLKRELQQHERFDAILYPEGYVVNEDSVAELCGLAKAYRKLIITGYRNRNNKDRALIIDATGNIVLERAKSPMDAELYRPSVVEVDGHVIGYLLCVELLQGLEGLEGQKLPGKNLDWIAQPIGVGMFSEEQFKEWIDEATRIAIKYNTMIVGTSHADGSYQNCGISIPISYCINAKGEAVYISKNDTRSWVVDLGTGEIEEIE